MLKYDPNKRLVYIGICFVIWIGVAAALVSVRFMWLKVLVVVVAIVWTGLSYLLVRKKVATRVESIIEILTESCDPFAFLEAIEPISQRATGSSVWDTYILQSKGLALFHSGKREEAFQVYDRILANTKPKTSLLMQAVKLLYLHSLTNSLYGSKQAINNLEEVKGILEAIKNPSERVFSFYESAHASLELMQAQLGRNKDELLEMRERILEDEQSTCLNKVRVSFRLVEVCHELGDEGCEKVLLDYVVANGNKLDLVGKAESRLEEII